MEEPPDQNLQNGETVKDDLMLSASGSTTLVRGSRPKLASDAPVRPKVGSDPQVGRVWLGQTPGSDPRWGQTLRWGGSGWVRPPGQTSGWVRPPGQTLRLGQTPRWGQTPGQTLRWGQAPRPEPYSRAVHAPSIPPGSLVFILEPAPEPVS
ncbi:unnamed protein product [Gadus morhua 'NCC']